MDSSTIYRELSDANLDSIADLWRVALGPEWPVLPAGLRLLRHGHVAVRNGRLVGVVAVDPAGSLLFVAVHPEHRRRGIGRRLVERALADLRWAGLSTVTAGSGGQDYVWPGIPTDRPDALAFFDRLGWAEDYVATDLVQDLQAPDGEARLGVASPTPGVEHSLVVAAVDPTAHAAALAFEDRYFPNWSRAFRESGEEIFVAWDNDRGTVVGTLLLAGPGRVSRYWPLLGEDCATIACVGVAPEREGSGIGSAMVAAASRLLARRGAGNCHIDWVVRVGFYERLGYRPWRRFSMRTRDLSIPTRAPAR